MISDRNKRYFRFRGRGLSWWYSLITRTAEPPYNDGNLFTQPDEPGEQVELIPTVQPTFNIATRDFDLDPSIRPVLTRRVYTFVIAASGVGYRADNIYDINQVRNYLTQRDGKSNFRPLHPTGLLDISVYATLDGASANAHYPYNSGSLWGVVAYLYDNPSGEGTLTDQFHVPSSYVFQDGEANAIRPELVMYNEPHTIGAISTQLEVPQLRLWSENRSTTTAMRVVVSVGATLYPSTGTPLDGVRETDLLAYSTGTARRKRKRG